MNNRIGVLIAAMVGAIAGLSFELYQTEEKLVQTRQELQIQTNRADSLDAAIWSIEVELFRFNRAYVIFSKRNPEAAAEYGTIISDETE